MVAWFSATFASRRRAFCSTVAFALAKCQLRLYTSKSLLTSELLLEVMVLVLDTLQMILDIIHVLMNTDQFTYSQ
jgi:hypothetical protein